MAADRHHLAAIAALVLVAIGARAAEPIAPGVRRVCVPAADGRTWECGTADNPPPQRPLAPRDSPPPPSFLAAPGGATVVPIEEAPAASAEPIRPRTDDFPAAPEREDPAPVVDDVASAEGPAPADEAARPGAEDASAAIASETSDAAASEPTSGEVAAEGAVVPEAPVEPTAGPIAEAASKGAGEPPSEALAEAASEDPVEPASAPAVQTRSQAGGEPRSEPPPFLAAPPRRGFSPGPPIEAASVAEAKAPVDAASPESGAEAVARETPPEPVAPPTPEPIAEPVEEPVAQAVSEADPVVEPPVDPVAPGVAEAPLEPEPAPTAASPPESGAIAEARSDPATTTTSAPRGSDEFLALSGVAYTVQLAHARDPGGFPALLASLGLDGSDAYAVPFDRDGARWWMLTWSSFPDAASARAALARLPRGEGINVGYPRRIALIQNELRK